MLTRISAKKIENSKIDGYDVRAYETSWGSFYGLSFANIPDWKYLLLVYQNKTNMYDVMVEIRDIDENGNWKKFDKSFFKSMIPPELQDMYYRELNGTSYIRGVKHTVDVSPSINMNMVYNTYGWVWLHSYGRLTRIAKKWSTVHNIEEANEVYELLQNVHDFNVQISDNSPLNNRINNLEKEIASLKHEIVSIDSEINRTHTEYQKNREILSSFGIDPDQFLKDN